MDHMSNDQISPHVQAMRQRVQYLYRQGYNTSEHQEVLSAAFEELAHALEELQSTDERLRQQREEWLNSRAALEMEIQRYQDLFTHAPAGYLVTSLDGAIRQANPAAAALLQSSERFLVGRALALFVPEGQRRAFRASVAQLAQADGVQEWEITLQSWKSAPFDARLTVGVLRGSSGRPIALYWLLCDISERKRADAALRERLAELEQQVGQCALGERAVGDPTSHAVAAEDPVATDGLLAQRQFAFLSEASVLLAVAPDADTTLAHVARLAVPAIADGCIIDIAEPHAGTVRQIVVVRDPALDREPRTFQRRYTPAPRQTNRAPTGEPPRAGITLPGNLLDQLDDNAELRAILGALKPTSALVVPLRARDDLLGSLTLALADRERQFGQTDLALAQELARRMAIAVDRMRS
jgi:PAS domain S-box-containing protein